MYCKNCGAQYASDASQFCMNCGVQKGVGEGFCSNCGEAVGPGAAVCLKCGAATGTGGVKSGKSRMVAGLLGIFLGGLGIHNFYLGNNDRGLIQILMGTVGSVLCGIPTIASAIWGLIEGIQILTGSIATDASGNPLTD